MDVRSRRAGAAARSYQPWPSSRPRTCIIRILSSVSPSAKTLDRGPAVVEHERRRRRARTGAATSASAGREARTAPRAPAYAVSFLFKPQRRALVAPPKGQAAGGRRRADEARTGAHQDAVRPVDPLRPGRRVRDRRSARSSIGRSPACERSRRCSPTCSAMSSRWSTGYVLHSRWSFRGPWQPRQCWPRTTEPLLHRLAGQPRAQQPLRLDADRAMLDGPTWWPVMPMLFVTPARHLRAQPPLGVRLMARLMERIVYDRMAELDSRHWWYRARREILADLIERRIALAAGRADPRDRLRHRPQSRHARRFGRVDAIEIDAAARAIASQRLGHAGHGRAAAGADRRARTEPTTWSRSSTCSSMSRRTRRRWRASPRKLKPGGRILITVPAHPWMWSAHDVVNHHKRRYTKQDADARWSRDAGPEARDDELVQQPALPARRRRAARRPGAPARRTATTSCRRAPLNALFEAIFGLERYAIGRRAVPAGRVAGGDRLRLAERHGRGCGCRRARPAISETM